jgi:hypothetical protein
VNKLLSDRGPGRVERYDRSHLWMCAGLAETRRTAAWGAVMASLPSGDRARTNGQVDRPLAERHRALHLLAGGRPPVADDQSPAQARLDRAAARDTAAAARDARARARDEAAELRDLAAAAAGAVPRHQAARDRSQAAEDREEAARERLRALVDREALAREARHPARSAWSDR